MDALTNSPLKQNAGISAGQEERVLEEENITKEQIDQAQNLHKVSNDIEATKKEKGIFDLNRIVKETAYRNNFLSGANAFLHGLATITNFIGKNNPVLKGINHVVDTAAFFCTRWLTPYISYGHAAYTAMANQKEPILSFIKLIPPAFFPITGDANIDIVYGASTGINQPYDLVKNRIKAKLTQDQDYAHKVAEARKTHGGFFKLIVQEFKGLLKDFAQGKTNFWKEGIFVVNCSLMLIGSIPMLLFGRDQRDTLFAQICGVFRNTGGILGDVGWGLGDVEPQKKIMALIYSLAGVADIVKRFVGEDLARVLIHLSAALNVTAMTMWNTLNTDEEKPLDNLIAEKMQANQDTEIQEKTLVDSAKIQEISKNKNIEKASYDMAL